MNNFVARKMYVYGIDMTTMKPVSYRRIPIGEATIEMLTSIADELLNQAGVSEVYAIDDYYGLYYDYMDAIQCKTEFTKAFMFLDILRQKGIMIRPRFNRLTHTANTWRLERFK